MAGKGQPGRRTNAQIAADERATLDQLTEKITGQTAAEIAAELSIEDAIERFGVEIGEDQEAPQIKVYRKSDGGGREFCEAYPITDFGGEIHLLKRIRDDFGPGKYNITLTHDRKWLINRDIRIAADPTASNRAKLDTLTDLGRQIDAVRADSQRMIAEAINGLKEVMRAAPPPGPDPMAQFQQTMTILQGMRGFFAPQKSAAEQIGELTGMLDVSKRIREMASEDAPGGDLLTTLAPKAMELIGAAIANGQSAQPIARQNARPQALPGPAPAATMAQASPAPQPNQGDDVTPQIAQMTPEERELVAAIGQLNLAAAFGQSPENYAEAVYERAPEELFDMLALPDWWDKLVAMAPAVAEHRDFYSRLKDAVLRIKAESESEDVQEGDAINGTAVAPAAPPAKAA